MDDNILKVMASLGLDFNPAENSIKAFENKVGSLNKQLSEMKALALQGAKDINNTFSSQLGNMTGSKTILDQYGMPLKTIQTQMAQIGTTSAKSYTSATKAAKEHSQSVKDVAKQYNVLGSEFSRRSGWFLSGSIFYGALKGSKEAIQTISEVEMGMVEIQRVMEDSTFVFRDYRDELLQMGVDYGQSFETVQDIALRWAQAGYNVVDSLKNTETSLLALNTAELDAKNATESLIGIMAQWKMTSADLPLLLDKLNKIGDDFTITSQDLIDGLLRSSSAARIMNLDINETIALLTAMREASGRTGQEVGNALNSILSYMQRPKSIDTLESMGINMFADEAKTQFRSVMEVFQDIQSKWNSSGDVFKDAFVKAADDTELFSEELAVALGLQDRFNLAKEEWNDLEKRDIAQSSAGVYRRNYFIGLIERLSTAQEVLNGLTTAAGYSQAENANTMETLEKKYQSLKTAAQQLAVALGDAGLLDIMKGLTDTATDVASGFAKMDDNARTLLITSLELLAAVKGIQAVGGMFTSKNLLFGTAESAALLPGWTKLLAIIPAVIGAVALYSHNLDGASDATNGLREKQDKLTESYANGLKAAEETEKSLLEQAATSETLAKKLEELNAKESLNVSEKAQLKDIVDRLNGSFSNLGLKIDENTGKVVGNTTAIWDNIAALKEQAIQQARQAKAQATAAAYVEQEILLGQTSNQIDVKQGKLNELTGGRTQAFIDAQAEINKLKDRGLAARPETNEIRKIYEKYGITNSNIEINKIYDEINKLKTLKQEQEQKYSELNAELDEALSGVIEGASNQSSNPYVPSVANGSSTSSSGTSSGTYKNAALDNALKALDYKKYLNQISLEDEISTLNQIKANHVNTADELMDINKRIYDAENSLMDERQKASEETYKLEESNIQHLAKLGVYSTEQQIEAYKELYSVKAESLAEEQKRVENLFNLYKQLLSKQQQEIKDAYDERMDLIDEEADRKKESLEDEKSALQEQLDLLDRKDAQRSHNNEMKSLQEELAYWQVRTSEEARKKVVELEKQIDEEKYQYDLEQKKQSINDKIDAIDDEIDEVERLAEKEKDKWEKSYKLTEKAFDEHSSNIVALAGTMSKEAYEQWEANYLTPLKNALLSGDFDSFNSIGGGLEGSINDLNNNVGNSNNAQIYRAAKAILNLKEQWTNGSPTAANSAKQYYNTLRGLGLTGQSVADFLSGANYESAKSYVDNLPKFHDGGWAYSDGLAVIKKNELIFPPDLSIKMDGLLKFLKGNPTYQSNSSTTDNRKDVKIDTLLKIERNYMEDEVDGEILARELGRQLQNL